MCNEGKKEIVMKKSASILKLGMVCALALSVLMMGAAYAEEHEGDVYTLGTCPISGKALDENAVVKVYDGAEVRFCCGGCPAKFEEDQEASTAKLDEQITELQDKIYPLETCIVSGEKLGEHGDVITLVKNNRLVKFCCKGCVPEFEKDTAKYITKLDEAVIEKQKESYALETCLVSGEDLGSMGGRIMYVAGNQLVEFCCKGCVKKFEATPSAYLSKLGGGAAEAGSEEKTEKRDRS